MTEEFVEANRANWDARVSDHLLAYGAEAFADDPSANTTIPWKSLPMLTPTPEGFVLPDGRERLPLMFSVAERKTTKGSVRGAAPRGSLPARVPGRVVEGTCALHAELQLQPRFPRGVRGFGSRAGSHRSPA